MKQKEHNTTSTVQGAEEEVIYRIDIPANRYDMLCLEGIARALNIFNGRVAAKEVSCCTADMTGMHWHLRCSSYSRTTDCKQTCQMSAYFSEKTQALNQTCEHS